MVENPGASGSRDTGHSVGALSPILPMIVKSETYNKVWIWGGSHFFLFIHSAIEFTSSWNSPKTDRIQHDPSQSSIIVINQAIRFDANPPSQPRVRAVRH